VTDVTDVVPAVCPSCGASRVEQFCPKCGEKRISAHDYSIAHFLEHSIEGLTHFDLRSLRTLKSLVLRPGELTRAFLAGRRRGYVGPIQLFLIINVVYALIGGNTFRTPLFIQEADPPMATMKRAIIASTIARGMLSHEEFAKGFDQNAGIQSKTWIFAMIPMFAACLATLYGFRRYFFEHLVFGAHFMAFLTALRQYRIGRRSADRAGVSFHRAASRVRRSLVCGCDARRALERAGLSGDSGVPVSVVFRHAEDDALGTSG
jgi:hypothetical protein